MQESTEIINQMECLCVEEFITSFFGTGASSKKRFALLSIGTNYILHQVIAAQITVGWESPAHHSWRPLPCWHILATFCPIDSHKVASL